MYFSYSNFSVFLLIFFCQGVLYALLLLQKRIQFQDKASGWLSLFLFLCAMYIAPFMLGYAGWYSDEGYRNFMFYVPFQQLFLIGPVIYFYTQSLLNPSFLLSKDKILHFLPAIIYLIYSLIVFITDQLILKTYYFYADEKDKDFDFWYQMTGLLSMIYYLSLSLKDYLKYRKKAFQELSFANDVLFKWVQQFLIAFLIILMLRILFFMINPEWGNFGNKLWYYACFSILFTFIAINGYTHAAQIRPLSAANQLIKPTILKIENLSISEQINQPLATENLDVKEWQDKINKLVRQGKIYENPRLTITDVANALDRPPKLVSRIINEGFQLNFNDFINQHRTEAVIEKFQQGAHETKTLLAIAYECGFNSKSTFNRAFKKHTQLTPKQYLEKMA